MSNEWQAMRSKAHATHTVVPGLLSAEECARALAICEAHPRQRGLTWNGSEYSYNAAVRHTEAAYLPRSSDNAWIYDRMDDAFSRLAKVWGLEVRETLENLKYVVYRTNSHFAQWHIDVGDDYSNLRKISMSVELNGSAEYNGGDLQIFPNACGHVAGPVREAGTAILFPSHCYHRVTHITRGVRHVLVNWISGPPLR